MPVPKYIENQHLPLTLSVKEHPQFFVYRIEKEGSDYRLHYALEDRGMSIHATEKTRFDKIPQCVQVVSGGWYGERGRWSPLERFEGTIICEGVSSYEVVSGSGSDYAFEVSKSWLGSTKKVVIESESVGKVELKCSRIVPQPFSSLLFSVQDDQWRSRGEFLDQLDDYLSRV